MAFSQNLRTRHALVTETVYGTTPATPSMSLVPITGCSINLTRATLDDVSIRSDRMERYTIAGNTTVGGDLSVDLTTTVHNSLLESAMNSAFSGKVLKMGTTQKSFTLEQASLDTNLYSVFDGLVVDKASFAFGGDGKVPATFSMVGQGLAVGSTQITGATYGAESAAVPFTHFTGSIMEGGSATAIVTSMDFNIDNGSATNYALCDTFAKNINPSMGKVRGNMTVYFQDNVLLNKFLSNVTSSVSITVNDGGANTMNFNFPKIFFTANGKTISTSGSIMLSVSFTAVAEATNNSPLVITIS